MFLLISIYLSFSILTITTPYNIMNIVNIILNTINPLFYKTFYIVNRRGFPYTVHNIYYILKNQRGTSGVMHSKMRCVKKESYSRGISVATVGIPAPGPDEVLIRVRYAGICGTDLHTYKWDEWSQRRIKLPLIMGHEFMGEVCQSGENAGSFRLGQRVSAEGHITCGLCRCCKNGQAHICTDVKIIGVDMDGSFAEYVCVPEKNVWPVHDRIPDRYAALFDPIGNAMHAVMKNPVSMKTVLITGAGPIGLFAISIAKENGASKIIVIEPNPFKKVIALKSGADAVFSPDEDYLMNKILEVTGIDGPDVFLEMSGYLSSIRLGMDILCNGGTAILLGIPSREIPLNIAEEIVFKGITIHGITGRRMYETWYQSERFLLKAGKAVEPIITHTVNIDNIEEGFLLMEKGDAAKVLIEIKD